MKRIAPLLLTLSCAGSVEPTTSIVEAPPATSVEESPRPPASLGLYHPVRCRVTDEAGRATVFDGCWPTQVAWIVSYWDPPTVDGGQCDLLYSHEQRGECPTGHACYVVYSRDGSGVALGECE